MQITLSITTFNREELLYESIDQVLNDDRISEIIISDDCSEYELYKRVYNYYRLVDKVKVTRTDTNIDCYRNKRKAISQASNEWVIILDSDNIISKAYIDCVENLIIAGVNTKTLYQPSFARPHFNFTKFESLFVNRHNVAFYMDDPTFQTMLNAMNYFVNRDEYIKVWEGSVDPVTSDSIYQNFNWLKAGNSIYIVPGLEYEHRIHEESHYKNNVRRTPNGFNKEIVNKLKAMK